MGWERTASTSHRPGLAVDEVNTAQPYRAGSDISAMGRRCLDRQTLLFTAAGQCPKERLPAVRRHLLKCSRCRDVVVRVASGGPLGDTLEKTHPGVVRRRALKTLSVAASLLGIAFAVAAAGSLDETSGAPVTQRAAIIVPVAAPTPTTNVAEAPNPASPADNRTQEPPPIAAKMKCPPTGLRVTTRARMPPVSPEPPLVTIV